MDKINTSRRVIAWTLIAALINPAAMAPAWARDTDIYQNNPNASSASEPNVMIVLDTSDSMNIPEPWREITDDEAAAGYDSHMEYLWNDARFINSIGCNAGQNSCGTGFTASSVNAYNAVAPFEGNVYLPQGYFKGATAAERQALKQEALTYASQTETGDPGNRYTYRNYGGYATVSGGSAQEPVLSGATRPNDSGYIYWLPAGTSEDDPRLRSISFNRFYGAPVVNSYGDVASGNPIVRGGLNFGSAIDGSQFNQCGLSLLDLQASTIYAPSEAPRNSGKYLGQQWLRWERWLDMQAVNASSYPGVNRNGTTSLSSGTFYTGYLGFSGDNVIPANPANAVPARDNQNQPIRVQQASSYAGWTTPKADNGGYIHFSWVNSLSDAQLAANRAVYGYPLLNVPNTSASLSGGSITDEEVSAWKGNRDNAVPPAFGMETGTPSYYDTAGTRAHTTGGSSPTCSTTTRLCGASGTTTYKDATDSNKTVGGSCSQTGTSQSGPGPYPNINTVAACGFSGGTNTFINPDNRNCSFRQPGIYVEGVGTLYPAASCQGNIATASSSPNTNATVGPLTTSACVTGGTQQTINGQLYVGTCSNKSDVNETCNTRFGTNCNRSCNNQSAQNCVGGSAGTTTNYTVYNRGNFDNNLYHDCQPEHVSGTYLRAPNSYDRSFTAANSYTSSAASALNWNGVPTIDTYSTNYLNYKYGPKGPNGRPIGRKTRLQIAKDALTKLVTQTNGVHFGLTVFNKQQSSGGTYGGNIAFNISAMGSKNCNAAAANTTGSVTAGSQVVLGASNTSGFSQGDQVVIQGAGPGGSNLGVILTSDPVNFDNDNDPSTPPVKQFTINTAASTTVSNTTISLLGAQCTPSEQLEFDNRGLLNAKIDSLVANAQTPLTETMYEVHNYFAGKNPYFGIRTGPAKGGGTESDSRDLTTVCTVGNTPECPTAGNYKSPMLAFSRASCQKNYVVLITDGGPEDDQDADDYILDRAGSPALRIQPYTSGTNIISPKIGTDNTPETSPDTPSDQFEENGAPYGPPDKVAPFPYVLLDELTYFMGKADISPRDSQGNDLIPGVQQVTTYTIGFAGANTPVIKNAATRSGGLNYVAEDSAQLSGALLAALNAIREWTPSIASPAVPAAAFNRAQSGFDIFMSFFAPSSSQAWDGTVKKFKLGISDPNPAVAAADTVCGEDAYNPGTKVAACIVGQNVVSGSAVRNIEKVESDNAGNLFSVINPASSSYWGPANLGDGGSPRKGGTGYQLLNAVPAMDPSTRKVYTFISGGSVSTNLSVASNAVSEGSSLITKALLGNAAMSDAGRSTLINFIRGGDPTDANCNDDPASGTACTAWRGWPHADVTHNNPRTMTYDARPRSSNACPGSVDSSGNPDPSQDPMERVLYYLSNDGLLHAVDTCSGRERWAFMIEETLPKLSTLLANNAGSQADVADGQISIYSLDNNRNGIIEAGDGDKAYLYFGLRRGGRAYYALDITLPDTPKLLWKIDNTQICNGATCAPSSNYDRLGYTWSEPTLIKLRDASNPTGYRLGVIVAGGYDPNQDADPVTSADTMGNAVYVIDGTDGSLIRAFKSTSDGGTLSGLDFSIPSDVTAINSDLDGVGWVDRAYVGDMAGNVWRFDIGSDNSGAWVGSKFAALSDAFGLPATPPNRKIFSPVSVVKQQYRGERFDAVYVLTGDREHPLSTTSSDRLYMLKDRDIGLSASGASTITNTNLVDITPINTEADFESAFANVWNSASGWYFTLPTGEKGISGPKVLFNVIRFSTYQPNPVQLANACQPQGESNVYGLDALFGGLAMDTIANQRYSSKIFTSLRASGYIGVGDPLALPSSPPGAAAAGAPPVDCENAPLQVMVPIGGTRGAGTFQPAAFLPCAAKTYWYKETRR